MNTQPSGRLREWLDAQQITPTAAVLAAAGSFLTWLFFEGALLYPFESTNNDEAIAGALGFLGVVKFLLVAAPVAALWWLWRALLLAAPMVIWVAFTGANVPMGLYVGLVAVAVVAVFRSVRVGLVALVAALVPIAIMCASLRPMAVPFGAVINQQYAGTGQNLALFGIYALVSFCLVGGAGLLRSRAATRLDQRDLASRRREVERQAVVTETRAGLARDLHDVVAHHVSLIAVRAETAPYQHPDLGDAARAVLAEIGSDARRALDELRDVLGVLRQGDRNATEPQPGAADVPALVEKARESGQEVRFEGALPHASASQGYVVYRVLQEALTNARRHAPGERVSVHLRGGGVDPVEVSVLNPARGSADVEPGKGLAGMRERVEALGGDLTATRIGPDFVVQVRLPGDAQAGSRS